jgi:hypothetical protein
MTEPIFRPGARVLGDADAMLLYEEATRLDRIPGQYPPDDTGSSGLAAAKAAKRAGYFAGYSHAFSAAAALDALAHVGPIMLGIKWWTGDDNPRGALALLEGGGVVRGGHEIEATEIDVIRKIIRGPNSWGPAWGAEGWWAMTFDELARRLRDQGDCVIPRGD